MDGYSLVAPQSASFRQVNVQVVRERLMSDARLHCSIDKRDSGFWLLWGNPPVQSQHGITCFGDIEHVVAGEVGAPGSPLRSAI